jgi:hypothetical protein
MEMKGCEKMKNKTIKIIGIGAIALCAICLLMPLTMAFPTHTKYYIILEDSGSINFDPATGTLTCTTKSAGGYMLKVSMSPYGYTEAWLGDPVTLHFIGSDGT